MYSYYVVYYIKPFLNVIKWNTKGTISHKCIANIYINKTLWYFLYLIVKNLFLSTGLQPRQ